MEIRISIPESEVGGIYAQGVRTAHSDEIVTLDFLAPADPAATDAFTVVRRIRLSPGAVEQFYLELGGILQARREREGK